MRRNIESGTLQAEMPIKLAAEKMGNVASAMTEVVCIIDHTASVAEAARTLADMHVTGAPVMLEERIVGVISQTDLLRAQDSATPVTEVMNETVYAVRPHDPLFLAVRLMVEQRIHRVIVVNDDGQLHGVVTSMDVLRVLAHGVSAESPLDYVDLRALTITTS